MGHILKILGFEVHEVHHHARIIEGTTARVLCGCEKQQCRLHGQDWNKRSEYVRARVLDICAEMFKRCLGNIVIDGNIPGKVSNRRKTQQEASRHPRQ